MINNHKKLKKINLTKIKKWIQKIKLYLQINLLNYQMKNREMIRKIIQKEEFKIIMISA